MPNQWTGRKFTNNLQLVRSKDDPDSWKIHGEHPFVRAQATTQELFTMTREVLARLEPQVKEDKLQWLTDYRRLTNATLREAQEAWTKAHPGQEP